MSGHSLVPRPYCVCTLRRVWGNWVGFRNPCRNVGRANQIIEGGIIAQPYIYDIRAAHTSLLDASIIYGVRMASEIEEDRFRIKEVRAAIYAAVRIHTVSEWRAQAIAQYIHNCIPLCPESPDPSSPPLLRKGLGTRLV